MAAKYGIRRNTKSNATKDVPDVTTWRDSLYRDINFRLWETTNSGWRKRRNRKRKRAVAHAQPSGSVSTVGGSSAGTSPIGIYKSLVQTWTVAWPGPARRSRTCRRTACREPSSWCSCRNNIGGLDSTCRSSCSACSSSRPIVSPPRPGRSSWTPHSYPPTWCSSSCCCPRGAREGTATTGSGHFLEKKNNINIRY